jgi:hypothetical protein
MSTFDAAEAIASLTNGYFYTKLQQFDKENKYYKYVFYGDVVFDENLKYTADDLRTKADYRTWAAANRAEEFMAVVMNGVEMPMKVTDVCKEMMKCLDEIERSESSGSSFIQQASQELYRRFGYYYAALDYFGKNKIKDRYLNDNYDLALFSTIKQRLNEFIKIGMGELVRYYDTDERTMRVNNVGMYLLRGSHRPKEFIDEYVKARQDYYDSIKDILEILQQQETLQLCINVAKIGDTLMTDNEDCNANLTQVIKQQVDCMNGVTKKTDKKNDEDNDTTGGDGNDADNNRKPKEKPKEEPTWFEKNKTTVIIGSVVGVVVLIMFALLIIMLAKNKKSTMPMNTSMMNPAMNMNMNPYQYMPNYSY